MNKYEKLQFEWVRRDLQYKEPLPYYLHNVIKLGLTKEQNLAYRVLRSHLGLAKMDVPFEIIPELTEFVWRNFYMRGLDISGMELFERTTRIGLRV